MSITKTFVKKAKGIQGEANEKQACSLLFTASMLIVVLA